MASPLLIAALKISQDVLISGCALRLMQAEALYTKAQPTEVKTKLGMRKFLYKKESKALPRIRFGASFAVCILALTTLGSTGSAWAFTRRADGLADDLRRDCGKRG
jgi:hypothetical protein